MNFTNVNTPTEKVLNLVSRAYKFVVLFHTLTFVVLLCKRIWLHIIVNTFRVLKMQMLMYENIPSIVLICIKNA